MNFYALFSRSSETYNPPFLAHDDFEAKKIIEKTITMQADPALMYALDDLQIERIGVFYDSDAKCPVDACDVEIICEDLISELCLPPMIRSMVDKLYSRKEERNDQ